MYYRKRYIIFQSFTMKLIWIFSLYISSTSPNNLKRVFEVFFHDNPQICYLSIRKINQQTFGKLQGEIWLSEQTTNLTCSGYKNFIILSYNENLTRTMEDLQEFIPVLSRILVVSRNSTHFRKLQSFILKKNWDLIIYKEDSDETTPLKPIHPTFSSKYSVCHLSKTLRCSKNTTNIFHFIQNRPHLDPSQIVRALNRTLTVVTIQNPPYTIVTNDTHITGVEIEVLKIIFQHPIGWKVLSKTSLSKVPVSQNPWINISRELMETEDGADLSISSLWMRWYPHDITIPWGQQCITFIVKRPKLYSELSFLFQSLSMKLWFIVASFLMFIIVVLTTIQSGLLSNEFLIEHDTGKTILDVLRTFAGSSMTRNLSGINNLLRIIFLLWLLLCLIMMTCYNAGLTTSLKYPKLTKEVKDFQDMIDQKIHWMDETDGTSHFMSTSDDAISKSLEALYESDPNKTYRDSKLAEHNYGFRIDHLPGGYVRNIAGIDQSILGKFQIAHGCYANVHMVIGLKPGSPFKKFFDDGILKMTQHGFMDRWYRKFAVMKRSRAMFELSSPNSEERAETLDFGKMKGAFLLLLFGLGVAIGVFVYEIQFSKI